MFYTYLHLHTYVCKCIMYKSVFAYCVGFNYKELQFHYIIHVMHLFINLIITFDFFPQLNLEKKLDLTEKWLNWQRRG